jgi:DNA-binding response OmpR family regulator
MKRILILEDDKVTQQLYRMLLADKNLHISFCGTVNEALISLMKIPFDLIISCLHIEARNCLQFLQLVHYWKTDIPIILISGNEGLSENTRIKNIANDILIKPVLKKEFLQVIDTHLENVPESRIA